MFFTEMMEMVIATRKKIYCTVVSKSFAAIKYVYYNLIVIRSYNIFTNKSTNKGYRTADSAAFLFV